MSGHLGRAGEQEGVTMTRAMLLVLFSGLALIAVLFSSPGPGTADAKRHSPPMYIALGDKVALGVGLSDTGDGYVSLFHEFLEGRRGFHKDVELRNLAADNATIWDVVESQLPVALAEIEARRADKDKKNDVRVVTIDVGLDDLWGSILVCADGPTGDCVHSFGETLIWHEYFMDYMLNALRTAGGPRLRIIVMTNYTPFLNSGCAFNSLAPAWDVALEGDVGLGIDEGMNDITRRLAAQYGARVADVYDLLGPDDLPANCEEYGPNADGQALIAREFARVFIGKRGH
jgi:lysophospholipase L1-like esterase